MRARAGATVNNLARDVWPAKVLPPIQILLSRPRIRVSIRKKVFVFLRIRHHRDADLPHVRHARSLPPFLLRFAQRWKEQARKDRDDCNDYQELNQREGL